MLAMANKGERRRMKDKIDIDFIMIAWGTGNENVIEGGGAAMAACCKGL